MNTNENYTFEDNFEAKRLAIRTDLTIKFSEQEPYLGKHDRKYFIDNTTRAIEFSLFNHLDFSKKLDPDVLTDFPSLIQSVDEI